MNRIKKVSRPAASLLALLLCVTLFASTAFAAGGALGADRSGTPYTYVIGYMYSGSSQTVNTREIFTSPNNYDIWLCPVCGRDPLGNSQGTALAADLYMPCYARDTERRRNRPVYAAHGKAPGGFAGRTGISE